MNVDIKIEYDHKFNFYRLKVYDADKGERIPYATSRVYEAEYEAEMAAALMKMMYDKIEAKEDFDYNLFDFNIRAIFRLVDSPNKW